MINTHLQVRHALPADHVQIASLMLHEANIHRHLDWRAPLDWLGSQNYWVLEHDGRIVATLACPEDPPGISWIRLFGYLPQLSGLDSWRALWDLAHTEISAVGQCQVAAIVVKSWFQKFLLSTGFKIKQNIVLLELRNQDFHSFDVPEGVKIRHMLSEDIVSVTTLDMRAFGSFWHNSADALTRAHAQAIYASVAEDDSGLLGYQISTGNAFGAHLARLAVQPAARGRGIGPALVSDLVHRLDPGHLARLSVNTQADNPTSLSLYKKLGFAPTGEQFPVLVHGDGV